MSHFLDAYRARVWQRLSPGEGEPASRLAQVLCLPSFHAETLLRATHGPSGTSFQLVTFSSSLWYSKAGEEPGRLEETVSVPPGRAAEFWDALDELNPPAIRDEPIHGVDGMSVLASWRLEDIASSFEAWSPSPESLIGRFIRRLYDLGWEVARDRVSIERLEQLHTYLHLGLPARIVDGRVKVLRIFGGLSSSDRKALRSLFSSLPSEEAIVVDMTNFDGMGTLVYPIFVEFSSSRSILAWAASPSARRHIESMGLAQPQVFDRTEDAVEWVARRSAQDGSGTRYAD